MRFACGESQRISKNANSILADGLPTLLTLAARRLAADLHFALPLCA